jgi:hypothetical protein
MRESLEPVLGLVRRWGRLRRHALTLAARPSIDPDALDADGRCWVPQCACGWTTMASTPSGARAAHRRHLRTAP